MYVGDVLGIKSCPAQHLSVLGKILENAIELSNELSDRSILDKKISRRQFACCQTVITESASSKQRLTVRAGACGAM